MAYTIISQNNNTTTLSDGVNTITVPSRVNLTSGNFTIVEVNNNMATLEDGDGNVYRDIPCVATLAGEGGGGGSSLPDQTGHSGEFLTTDGTDASWSAVNALPDQTGHSGEFLTTDGSSASWSNTFTDTVYATFNSSVTKALVGRNYTSGGGRGFYLRNQTGGSWNIGLEIGTYDTMPTTAIGNPAIVVGPQGVIPVYSNSSNKNLGNSSQKWTTLYVTKINNGYDISVPAVAGKMAVQVSAMPTAASTNEGEIYQFVGTTDSTYTHGYIYECKAQGTDPETYAWEAVEVQAGGLSNTATGNNSLSILGAGTNKDNCVEVGFGATASDSQATVTGRSAQGGYDSTVTGYSAAGAMYSAVYGYSATAYYQYGIAYGADAVSNAIGAIQIGKGTNADAGTLKIGQTTDGTNWANIELLTAAGLIPVERLAAITGLADGNYKLRLTITNGVPTLSWVAE